MFPAACFCFPEGQIAWTSYAPYYYYNDYHHYLSLTDVAAGRRRSNMTSPVAYRTSSLTLQESEWANFVPFRRREQGNKGERYPLTATRAMVLRDLGAQERKEKCSGFGSLSDLVSEYSSGLGGVLI